MRSQTLFLLPLTLAAAALLLPQLLNGDAAPLARPQGPGTVTAAVPPAPDPTGDPRDARREGQWREWFPSGAMRSELDFRAGQPHGAWREWDEAGALRSEGQYEAGEETGRWSFWFEGGGLSERGEMFQGARDGAWNAWHPNGQKRFKTYPNLRKATNM